MQLLERRIWYKMTGFYTEPRYLHPSCLFINPVYMEAASVLSMYWNMLGDIGVDIFHYMPRMSSVNRPSANAKADHKETK